MARHLALPRLKLPLPADALHSKQRARTHVSLRLVQIAGPLVMTAVATTVLFVSASFGEPMTLFRASMGVALLFAVFVRQAGLIVELDRQVANRERQLSVMGDVVSVLSASHDIEQNVKQALERITSAVSADAAAIWLPDGAAEDGPAGAPGLVLAEQVGLPWTAFWDAVLEDIRQTPTSDEMAPIRHQAERPDAARGEGRANCLTVRLGRRSEDLGYLTVVKWRDVFDVPDEGILQAIGSDIAGTLRSLRLLSEAQKLADRDPVTGVYNHRYAFQRLYAEAEKHARTERPVSVLMLDLDNFKLFNDTYGHITGDQVLKKAARVLKRTFRDTDIVARYGGDEFLVILPDCSLENALLAARRLQHAFNNEDFTQNDTLEVPIYVSCGVANCPKDSSEVLELVAIADANLYEAKLQGKGQVTARALDVMDKSLLQVEGFDLLRSLVIAVDNKDRYTRKHSEEVTAYSLQIATAMGLDSEMHRTIHVCGLLHDLGKIGVPDRILRKPGKLTPEEVTVMNQHPVVGALIVDSLPGMELVVHGVRHHHERWDGNGYPDRLAGTDIPLIARILAVADVFSAMTTHRPYRKALSREEALAQIERGRGTHFDAEIADIFLRIQREQLRRPSALPVETIAAR